jgi:hypothetical protein
MTIDTALKCQNTESQIDRVVGAYVQSPGLKALAPDLCQDFNARFVWAASAAPGSGG